MAYIHGLFHVNFDNSGNPIPVKSQDENYQILEKIYKCIDRDDFETFIQLYPEYLNKAYDYFTFWELAYPECKYEQYHFYPYCICYKSYNEAEGNFERVHRRRYSLKCYCHYGKKYLLSNYAKKKKQILDYILNYDNHIVDLSYVSLYSIYKKIET